MSWDVTLYRFGSESPDEPDEEGRVKGQTLGTYDELKSALSSALPIEWEDSGWGTLTSPDFTIEFNMSSDCASFDSLTLHIHEPEFAMHAVHELATRQKWCVFDEQEGKFIDIHALNFIPADEDLEDAEDADEDDFYSETLRRPELDELRYL
jgi:hypothetical protein